MISGSNCFFNFWEANMTSQYCGYVYKTKSFWLKIKNVQNDKVLNCCKVFECTDYQR